MSDVKTVTPTIVKSVSGTQGGTRGRHGVTLGDREGVQGGIVIHRQAVLAVLLASTIAACGSTNESSSVQPSTSVTVAPSPTITVLDEKAAGERYMTIVCPANAVQDAFDTAAQGVYLGSAMTTGYRKALRKLAAADKKAARQLIATVLVVDLLGDHHLQLVTGGHPSPMIISPDGRMRPVGLRGNLPGLLPDTRIDPLTLQLARGERLLMATDGVAPQSAEMLDGIPKTVSDVLRKSPTMTIEQVSEMLCEALREALGPYPMDDWTFVLIERSDFTPARP